MDAQDRNSFLAIPVVVLVGCLIAYAGSRHGTSAFGVPVFALSVGLAFIIQWVAFIPAYLLKTEKFYDLTGSITYVSVVVVAVSLDASADPRSLLLSSLVAFWAVRLGGFLFTRIRRKGRDDRFDGIRQSFPRFLMVWTLQALWVTFTASAALAAITSTRPKALDVFAVVGLVIWVFGFAFEVIADFQKSRFNAHPENEGRFIRTGLWARSRHPNYFGEIVLWVGVAVIASPVLQGWQWVTLSSPVLVALLITRVSGVPLLEQKADAKWGGNEDYETYKKRTPVLIPRW
jgi:steroid 5-alpha reductase family enzyme